MCSVGPCRMKVEQYRCSSPHCSSSIVSEGRENCVLLDKVTSGATHAVLRRELFGVVISNGTLTGRLRHYHSYVTANAFLE